MKKVLWALIIAGVLIYFFSSGGGEVKKPLSEDSTTNVVFRTELPTTPIPTTPTPLPIPEPYYYGKRKEYSFEDLVKFIMENEVPHPYERDYFDCSEMSAYYEWKLENAGFDTKILVGFISFKRWTYENNQIVLKTYFGGPHAYLKVKTKEGEFFVDPASSIMGHQIPSIILPGNLKMTDKRVVTYNYHLTNKLFEIGLCQFYPHGNGMWSPFNDPYFLCSSYGLSMISQEANDYEAYSKWDEEFEDIYEAVDAYGGVSEWDWWNVLGYEGGGMNGEVANS
ncbi:MAG: hypothetical protein XD40_0825 [Archaeoglobus fulgidus]|uniref:Uncharacterized protein n=2 Tax=Archaeoglobus fulgidus TaxID=2234 RepID=A0A075WNS9_ARCFL|nr:hypothetical protein [Archaeoglobus fulgidus]AIG99223.1 hypothetical protein AFULGI_00025080 [Archaeoglobus fulgidus DSM 8774]KUJ94004.1 MAG: hypothetical protein XD40_0825 [Archaeoglobus fulgidus]KUK07034.1 MAG: hypothetical protein XD48_0746 [Archaeoglobus fulgidus]